MFCGILANKIIKSVFKLEIQIYIKHPPSTTPTKAKGKVQQLCTQYCTFRPNIPSAAYDLAPQTETTTVSLVFRINPSSMPEHKHFSVGLKYSFRSKRHLTYTIQYSGRQKYIPFFRKLKNFENYFKKSKILKQKTLCFWLWGCMKD